MGSDYFCSRGYTALPQSGRRLVCRAGTALPNLADLSRANTVVVMRKYLVAAGLGTLVLVLACTLALLSVLVERTGPELVEYGNLCGPTRYDPCYKPALKGGFPVAYLYDAPGVSIERRLSFFEDRVRPAALAIDVVVYLAGVIWTIRFVRRNRSPSGRSRLSGTRPLCAAEHACLSSWSLARLHARSIHAAPTGSPSEDSLSDHASGEHQHQAQQPHEPEHRPRGAQHDSCQSNGHAALGARMRRGRRIVALNGAAHGSSRVLMTWVALPR